ncbi:uncharacterized protein LOC133185427 [Saccostrea echinata]|uniref:uncharacterized protein LOC133185427 n=1 Tax=Saccostrea echinata TaxID=191078 RepID=UPI002A83E762|nr:uncharacterized protein LOC133185427 [Saccostrea echinata]
MADRTTLDTNEEFVDCTDIFLDKVIEDCMTVPSSDHLPDESEEFCASVMIKENLDLNLRQGDEDKSDRYYNFSGTVPYSREKLVPLCLQGDDISFDLDENISIIRRSQSDDLLSTSRSSSKNGHFNLQRPTKSEKNSREIIYPHKTLNDTLQSTPSNPTDGLANDASSDASSCNVDFMAEYERRVDLLECSDYALEEAFVMIRGCVEKLCLNNGILSEIQEQEQSNEKRSEVVMSEEAEKDEENDKHVKEKDQKTDKDTSDQRKTGNFTECQDNKVILKDLLALLGELESRFEHFTSDIGDLVQLGALSAKHAMRLEQYAKIVQSTYVNLRADNEKIHEYLQDKEANWVQTQAQLHNEIVRQTEEIQTLMTELSKSSSQNRIRNQMQDRHLNKVKKDVHSTEDIVDLMLHQRCSIEKAMAQDFSRQSKIHELKLLVLQQQSYVQKLELQNKEMDLVLRGLLFSTDEPQEPPKDFQNISPLKNPISMISDVLFCDQAQYLVDKSTDSSLVSEQVFQIGDSTRSETQSEAVFDPQRLSYVRNKIREQEIPESRPVLARDLGSGESKGLDDINVEHDARVEESINVQILDDPASFEEFRSAVEIQEQ